MSTQNPDDAFDFSPRDAAAGGGAQVLMGDGSVRFLKESIPVTGGTLPLAGDGDDGSDAAAGADSGAGVGILKSYDSGDVWF
jgi:prepilin-type processing-associated H-X9-DG protein